MRSCPQFPQSLIQVCPSAALSPLPVSHILCIQSGGPFQCLASRVGRLHQHPSRNRVSFLNPFSAPAVLISSPKSLLYGLLRTPPPISSTGFQFNATRTPQCEDSSLFLALLAHLSALLRLLFGFGKAGSGRSPVLPTEAGEEVSAA